MNKFHKIKANSEDIDPQIFGITSSEEKRKQMLSMLRDTAGEDPGTKNETYPFLADWLIINDQAILF